MPEMLRGLGFAARGVELASVRQRPGQSLRLWWDPSHRKPPSRNVRARLHTELTHAPTGLPRPSPRRRDVPPATRIRPRVGASAIGLARRGEAEWQATTGVGAGIRR
jgi:hypothetical protein